MIARSAASTVALYGNLIRFTNPVAAVLAVLEVIAGLVRAGGRGWRRGLVDVAHVAGEAAVVVDTLVVEVPVIGPDATAGRDGLGDPVAIAPDDAVSEERWVVGAALKGGSVGRLGGRAAAHVASYGAVIADHDLRPVLYSHGFVTLLGVFAHVLTVIIGLALVPEERVIVAEVKREVALGARRRAAQPVPAILAGRIAHFRPALVCPLYELVGDAPCVVFGGSSDDLFVPICAWRRKTVP